MQVANFVHRCAGPSHSAAAHLDGLDASPAFLGNPHNDTDPDAWFQHGDHPALGLTDYFDNDQDNVMM